MSSSSSPSTCSPSPRPPSLLPSCKLRSWITSRPVRRSTGRSCVSSSPAPTAPPRSSWPAPTRWTASGLGSWPVSVSPSCSLSSLSILSRLSRRASGWPRETLRCARLKGYRGKPRRQLEFLGLSFLGSKTQAHCPTHDKKASYIEAELGNKSALQSAKIYVWSMAAGINKALCIEG